MDVNVFYGILIPFLGTSAGAACVFFMKKNLNEQVQRALTGFAAGVMVAASVWSLLIPAIEQSADMGKLSFVLAVLGLWAGVLFLLLLDHVILHLHQNSDQAEGPKSKQQKTTMPLRSEGMGKGKAFVGGMLSGIVEPIGAILTILAAGLIVPALPYLLSFAAGAMLYVVVEELIPEMSTGEHSNVGTIFFAVGFSLMMVLDVALG
ncbi:ZIP family metal transporter [Blautia schinkii]|uniref:ZIP family metal transporter n=1 Tax=Blautia schinkii TaxID=180164 RepID=UPI00156D7ABB|nr:ZIP family metal transporter [Blautia schinkii]NSG81639.1 ZIP family metal transporter [Blautia schinkii]NSK22239.1 ZIP family metal transporter [Blautia schinkii]NSK25405.1 ZIP family metal transporter [Blautia schinkii]NSK31504.1 ZIP family metal transporter [Blautia schinkii]NSK48029.1 ZIP family metal transporter [Blautia schinkii]